MKIGVTSDNHVQANRRKVGNSHQIGRMAARLMQEDVEAFLVLGDMGDGAYTGGDVQPDDYDVLLGTHPNTMYVPGNHDLYRNKKHRKRPAESLLLNQKLFPASACLLEPRWDDETTMRVFGTHVFVGTLGWCDFTHPGILETPAYHCHKDVCPIHDIDFIDLRKWPEDVIVLNGAFMVRLKKAMRVPGATDIVIAMHTSCFPSHSLENPDSLMWRYFYNYRLGQEILYLAKQYPELKFWCLSGHSHEYNRGIWSMEAPNLYTFGFQAKMTEQRLMVFDTDMDIVQLRGVKTIRFLGGESNRRKRVFGRVDSGQGSGDL